MKIITPGTLPAPPAYIGTCKRCGCVVEEVKPMLKLQHLPIYNTPRQWWNPFQDWTPSSFVERCYMECPTEFCGRNIPMEPVDQT